MCDNMHSKNVLASETIKYKPNVLYLDKNLNESQSVKNFQKNEQNYVLTSTFRSSSSKSIDTHKKHNKNHRSSPPQSRHSAKKSAAYRSSSSVYPPFEYLTNNLNYNYMINYENSKHGGGGGGDGGSGSSSSGSGSGTATNSPSYSIANDDIEIFNRLNREDLMVDHFRWLSEKPLSVLQLDPADRAVLKIAG